MRNTSSSSTLSSSLAMSTNNGSTHSCILSLWQYSLSCLTTENHTSLFAKELASINLACRSARVKRRRDDHMAFHAGHTCSMPFNSGWPSGSHTTSWLHSQMKFAICYWGSGWFCWQTRSSWLRVATGGMEMLLGWSHLIRSSFLIAVVGDRLSSVSWVSLSSTSTEGSWSHDRKSLQKPSWSDFLPFLLCFIAWKWPFLLLNNLPSENKYSFTMLYKFSIEFKTLMLGNQFMHESLTNLRSCIQFLE